MFCEYYIQVQQLICYPSFALLASVCWANVGLLPDELLSPNRPLVCSCTGPTLGRPEEEL